MVLEACVARCDRGVVGVDSGLLSLTENGI